LLGEGKQTGKLGPLLKAVRSVAHDDLTQ